MKLSSREAPGYFAKPDPRHTGLLIFGADAMRVALRRQEVVAGLLGKGDDLGLTRLAAGDVRRTPSMVADALKEVSMFSSGQRIVLVEDATDALAPALTIALEDWSPGDAYLLVTAGGLNARSKLRKAFEAHSNAYAVGIYDDPPSRAEVENMLTKEGLTDLPRDTMGAISDLAKALDPGDFRQFLTKLALYKRGDDTPLNSDDIAAVAPVSLDADMDDLLHIVAEGRTGEIGPTLRRLQSQGVVPVTLAIGATRHFRLLHSAASDPGGAAAGLSRARPPVFGPRRDRMARQASAWGLHKLESALTLLTDTDLTLRSASSAPPMAVMERALIRLAVMGGRRG
ncbi:MAG: DNA polymerase III subunit delta [Pseudomonadota bacterium]